jgi:WD40 repeat protein
MQTFARILALGFILLASPVQSQPCFEKFFKEGIKFYEEGYPDQAINRFKAAKICPDAPAGDTLDKWITLAQNAYIENLKKARDEAQASAQRAMANSLITYAWNIYREDHTLALRIAQTALKIDSNSEDVRRNIQTIVNLPTTSYYRSVLKNQEFAVYALRFSPDSRTIAVGAWDGTLLLYDLAGNLLFQAISERSGGKTGHKSVINDIAWNADGKSFLTVSNDATIKWWSHKGELLKTFEYPKAQIFAVNIAPDGRHFLVASRDSVARMLDWQGKIVKTLRGHSSDVTSATWSPSGRNLLTGSKDGRAILWDSSGQIIRTFEHEKGVNSVAFSPDGQTILTSCSDRSAKIWNISGEHLMTFYGHDGELRKAVFSPDGKYILTGSLDKKAKIWSTKGEEIITLVGHLEKIETVAWSPDGQYVATGSWDFTGKIWNVALNLKDLKNQHTSAISSVAVSPDGKYILTGSSDFSAKIWDDKGEFLREYWGHTDAIYATEFSPDGKKILTAGRDRTARLWDAETGQYKILPGHKVGVGGAGFSPDGSLMATTEHNGQIHLWDNNGREMATWKGHNKKQVVSVVFSPDGRSILTAGRDSTACIWDLEGNMKSVMLNDASLNCAVFSPDGQSVYTAGKQMMVKKWALSGVLEKEFFGHIEEVYSIAFTSDGSHFITGSWDKTVKIWDTAGIMLHNIIHPDAVYDVAVSPGDNFWVSGSRDNLARIYDFNGELVRPIGAFEREMSATLTSPEVTTLSNIPTSFSRYDIPIEYMQVIFSGQSENLLRLAWEVENLARLQLGDYEQGNKNFQKAVAIYQEALRLMPSQDTAQADSIIAECYYKWADHQMRNKKFAEAAATARKGMEYKPLEYLRILEVIGTLYSGDLENALRLGRPLKGQPLKEITWYADFSEAFVGEVDYFKNFGIRSPYEAQFIAEFSSP